MLAAGRSPAKEPKEGVLWYWFRRVLIGNGALVCDPNKGPEKFTIQGFFSDICFPMLTSLDEVLASLLVLYLHVKKNYQPVAIMSRSLSIHEQCSFTLCISCPKLIQSKSRCSHTGFPVNRGKIIPSLPSTFKHWEADHVISPTNTQILSAQQMRTKMNFSCSVGLQGQRLWRSTWAIPTSTHHLADLSQLRLHSCKGGSCSGTQHTKNQTNAQGYRNGSGTRHDIKLG